MVADCCSAVLFRLTLGLAATASLGANPTSPGGADVVPAAVSRQTQSGQSAPATQAHNRWRYRFYNGHWWYWLPSEDWAYWTGRKWRKYDGQAYSEWLFRRQMAEYEAAAARVSAAPYPGGYPIYFGTYGGSFDSAAPLRHGFSWGGGIRGAYPGSLGQGDLNIGTSVGGYMGGALKGPGGY